MERNYAAPKGYVDLQAVENVQTVIPGQDSNFEGSLITIHRNPFRFNEGKLADDVDGITFWGRTKEIIDEGMEFVNRDRSYETVRSRCLLLEGLPNAGTSALAAYLAKECDFPVVKFINSFQMINYMVEEKCQLIQKIFEDAHQWKMSCIFLDDVEHLMRYSSIGTEAKCQLKVLDTLKDLLSAAPPEGHPCVVICTSKRREVLEELELLPRSTKVVHVPLIETAENFRSVLDNSKVLKMEKMTRGEIDMIMMEVEQGNISVGVKKLLRLLDLMFVVEGGEAVRAAYFVSLLEDENVLNYD